MNNFSEIIAPGSGVEAGAGETPGQRNERLHHLAGQELNGVREGAPVEESPLSKLKADSLGGKEFADTLGEVVSVNPEDFNEILINDPEVSILVAKRADDLLKRYYTPAYFEGHSDDEELFFHNPAEYSQKTRALIKPLIRNIIAEEIADRITKSSGGVDADAVTLKIRDELEKMQGESAEPGEGEESLYSISDKLDPESAIATPSELRAREASLPRPIDTREWSLNDFEAVSEEREETIKLADVLGGYFGDDWFTDDQSHRSDPQYTFKIAQMFQDGTLNIDTREPIRVDELEGKYYISGDGRHRVAALKLLDVDSIPALVTKIRKK